MDLRTGGKTTPAFLELYTSVGKNDKELFTIINCYILLLCYTCVSALATQAELNPAEERPGAQQRPQQLTKLKSLWPRGSCGLMSCELSTLWAPALLPNTYSSSALSPPCPPPAAPLATAHCALLMGKGASSRLTPLVLPHHVFPLYTGNPPLCQSWTQSSKAAEGIEK